MMDICFEAWDAQPSGYIFICSKRGKTWQDYPFSYPGQADEIRAKAKELEKSGHDTYWSLFTFSRAKRREEYAQKSPILYADLDYVDPRKLDSSTRPSVAWKSSNDRFQALWYLDKDLSPEQHKQMNRNLTYHIEADRGGWDLTQVLRIPGSKNYKYDPPQQGKVLWDDQVVYRKKDLEFEAPDTGGGGADLGSFVALLSKHRKKIPSKVSRMLQYPESRIEVGKRSEVLWYLESELVNAKIPLQDVVGLIAGSAWNKYRGRSDEMKRLTTEIEKIYTATRNEPSPAKTSITAYEDGSDSELESGLPILTFGNFMGSITSRPGWMIRDIWLRRSHGIIAGDPKTFKSTVAMDIAVSVASGRPLWNNYPVEDQGPVIIIQNENSDWIVKDRMEKIMASKGLLGAVGDVTRGGRSLDIEFAPELPIAFLNNYGFSLNDPLHLEQLEDYLAQVKPALVMFDPLYLMFEGEMNSAKELGPALQWLLSLKNKFNTSVMLIHHWNKNGAATRGGQRMLGSVALHGWTESGLFLQAQDVKAEDADAGGETVGQLILEREFRAAGIMPKLQLEVKAFNTFYSCSVLGSAMDRGLSEVILALILDKGGMSLSSLARELDMSRDMVQRIIAKDPTFKIVGEGQKRKVVMKK